MRNTSSAGSHALSPSFRSNGRGNLACKEFKGPWSICFRLAKNIPPRLLKIHYGQEVLAQRLGESLLPLVSGDLRLKDAEKFIGRAV